MLLAGLLVIIFEHNGDSKENTVCLVEAREND